MDNLKDGWTAPKIVLLTAAGASEGGILANQTEDFKSLTTQGGFVYGARGSG